MSVQFYCYRLCRGKLVFTDFAPLITHLRNVFDLALLPRFPLNCIPVFPAEKTSNSRGKKERSRIEEISLIPSGNKLFHSSMTKFPSNELFFHTQIDAPPSEFAFISRDPVENFHRFDHDKNRVSAE